MTTQTTAAVSVDAIDAALGAATRTLSEDEQRLAVAVFGLLAEGHPVTIAAAAQAAAIPEPRAAAILRSFPAAFWDGHGQVAGFSGLCSSYLLWQMYQRPARARRRADWGSSDHAV